MILAHGIRCAAVAMALLTGGCRDAARIALEEGSTMTRLGFVLTTGAGPASVSAFRVDRCNARGSPAPESHWLTLAPDRAESLAHISYGNPPPGWRSVQGPQPMAPGCYRAAIANAPPLEFDVLPDGQVKARQQQ